jgi:hypothetical protein
MNICKNYLEKHQIITGERIQQIADVYIGDKYNFEWNPVIYQEKEKHKNIHELFSVDNYENPKIVFCYSHLIPKFVENIHKFMNPFILITHNSDYNVTDCEDTFTILMNEKVVKWYTQNLYINDYEKLFFLPIGIANSQWPHGNLDIFDYIHKNYEISSLKSKLIYFSFKLETNMSKRQECFDTLKNTIPFLSFAPFEENLIRMMNYKYCICPVGNGIDTHRLWEAYYLKIVPIMVEDIFSKRLKKMKFPILLVKSWEELDIYKLPLYSSYDFSYVNYYLDINNIKNDILDIDKK